MEALFLNLTLTQAGEAVCSHWQSSSEGGLRARPGCSPTERPPGRPRAFDK